MSAGWMNEFVEVVLGSAIIIPIAVGYLGIDKVIELTKSGGLGLVSGRCLILFYQWGDVLGGHFRFYVVWPVVLCRDYFFAGYGYALDEFSDG